MDDRLALTLVTGFLGSGKTTLIKRYVETEQGADTGIIVNEFGEAGVDHSLFVHAAEQVELVDGGCLCCAKRADVAQAMYRLVQLSRTTGAFSRAVLETSGLADPAPIVATLQNDPWLKSHVRLSSIVTVIDAVAGCGNLERHAEARRQLALADTVVVTKTDMRAAEPFDTIVAAVRRHSPDARIIGTDDPDYRPQDVLGGAGMPTRAPSFAAIEESERHSADLSSFTIRIDETLDWPLFTLWLSALLHAHGERILRVKGLLRTSSSDTRLAVHGVQHVMHPPVHLERDEGGDSYLVFITRGIDKAAISGSLRRTRAWDRAA